MEKKSAIVKFKPVDFDPFAGPQLIRVAPATESQLEIWVSCVLGGEDANRSYNESVSLRLSGAMNVEAMRGAIQQVIDRHEAFRSSFSADGSQICVCETLQANVYMEDISLKTKSGQETFIEDFSQKDASTAFDLLRGPLFRIALLKLSDWEHYLKITAHHIVCDGWSLGIVLQDLSKIYSNAASGLFENLAPAFDFSQYALEQREFEMTEAYQNIEAYWLSQYRDNVPVLNLPTDFPRPVARTYKSHRDDYQISEDLVLAIKKIGAKAGCSFVTTLLGAFEIFIHRLTTQYDVVLGLPASGQSATDHPNLVGHCVNLLPLRSRHDGELSYIEYLKTRKTKLLDDYDHQRFTFGSLLKKLTIPREPSRVPLVPVVFNIDLGLDNGVNFHGLSHQMAYNPREYENFEIFLNASGSEKALVFEWSYNTQLFKSSGIKKMMDDFIFLLGSIIENPNRRIKEIPRSVFYHLDEKLKSWNSTSSQYSKDWTLQHLISEMAGQYPEKIAVRAQDRILTYSDLERKSNQFARCLLAYKIQRGDLVAIAVDRSVDLLVALIGTLKSGAAYIPIDPQFPQKRIQFMLNDSDAKLMVTSARFSGRFGVNTKELVLEDIVERLSDFNGLPLETGLTGADLAYVLYTSGSTGNPKGVQIEHHSLVNFLLSMQKRPGLQPGDRLLAVTTISFDIAGLELYLPLISGAETILADADIAKDGRALLQILESGNVTVMQGTPATWRMILDAGWESLIEVKILCGGEALPKDIASRLISRCTSLWNLYGPTETTIWSTIKQVKDGEEILTIGKPIDNTQIYILDEHMHVLPEMATGEIFIGGDGVGRGYLRREELSAQKFLTDPFAITPGAKMYRTGDLGRFLDNGEIQCLGRVDFQVKIRGYRIELEEIEQSLLKEQGVRQVVVVARDEKLVGYVVPTDISRASEGSLEQSELFSDWKLKLKTVLPDYMIPSEFVMLEKFPLTPNGKIDRKALPQPGQINSSDAGGFVAPRTDNEKLIAAIWSDLLKIEKLSVHDDFFELGGHSLIAVQAMTRLERETGKRLPLASLLKAPTIEKLSLLLQKDEAAIAWDSLVPIKTNGSKIPIYIVHGIGMNVLLFNNVAKNMDGDQPVYALQAKGLKTLDDSVDTMEEIAAHYISEILAHDTRDRFALAGYSFGGIIAFEMAKQLKAMGKEIQMLAMFDTNADNSDYFDDKASRFRRKIGRQFPKMFFILKSLIRRPLATLAYQSEFFSRKVKSLFSITKRQRGANKTNEDILAERYDYAYQRYKMTPYDGPIDLFRVKTRLYYLDDMEYLGWKLFTTQQVFVHVTPGDHKTFLYPPFDREFAQILQRVLDERSKEEESTASTHRSFKLKAV